MNLQVIMVVVLILIPQVSGCKDTTIPSKIKAPLSLEELVEHARVLMLEDKFAEYSHLLNTANTVEMALSDDLQSSSRRYVCIAEELLLIPGIPLEVEDKIIRERSFIELPGLGDDSRIPKPHRKQVFQAAHHFAEKYNQTLYMAPDKGAVRL